MQQLLVYRSSAGSGKTYTLVKTYLTLLFKIPSDYGFKQILAITFTNKAAAEMKKRVLDALDKISKEEAQNNLAIQIAEENDFDINTIVHRARIISQKILHNYKDFNLLTIDKFTNKVIRSFSNELGISTNYHIVLEENEFIEDVVSEYIDEISKDEIQLEILENMIDHSINLGLKNNIEKQLNKLKNIILKSNGNFKNPMSFNEIQDFRKWVYNDLKTKEKQIKELGNSGLSLLNEFEIQDHWMSYNRIKSVLNTFEGLSILNFKDIEKWKDFLQRDQWFKKTLKKEEIGRINLVYDKIISIIEDIIKYSTLWLKLLEVHKMIIPFSMVQSLIGKINQEKTSQNSILISDFNDLVSSIIKEEPPGFIFEKIGSRFKYILIDEFQDTSSLQWNNLIPLIHESLSVGGQNLIVGDAKQAIYRWRNGNVNQFVDLPKISDSALKNLYEPLFNKSILEKELDNNWRSSKNIVGFNNWVFKEIIQNLDSNNILKSYKGLSQFNKRSYEGLVDIQIINKSTFELTNYLNKSISSAETKGYSLKDISILVRSKREAISIINSLLILKKPFISEDGLFLNSALSFRAVYALLSYLETKDERNLKLILHYLNIYFLDNNSLIEGIKSQILSFDFDNYNKLYDFQKINFAVNFLHFNSSDPFIDFFINISNQLLLKDNFSMFELLDYFNKKSGNLTIESSAKNAIQVLTIHKSKGLEFPVVIIPFTNWHINNNIDSAYTWLDDIDLGEKKLNIFIGDMTNKSLKHLDKESVFINEQEEVLLDTLNLYYVAFTRAMDHLYIAFEENSKKNNLSSLMVNLIKEHNEYNLDTQSLHLSNPNELCSNDQQIIIDNSINFSINDNSSFSELNKLDDQIQYPSATGFGTFFHDVISKVYDDFSYGYQYLNQKKLSPSIEESFIFKTKEYLDKIQQNASLNFIFESNQIIYNEKEFISQDNEVLRLDRLIIRNGNATIIDYKTSKGANDLIQVKNYLKNINNMDFKSVTAFLLYVNSQELVEVIL